MPLSAKTSPKRIARTEDVNFLQTRQAEVGSLDGTRHYFKEGGGGGFHSMMRLYPDRGIGSVVIANATGFRARAALDEIDRLLL